MVQCRGRQPVFVWVVVLTALGWACAPAPAPREGPYAFVNRMVRVESGQTYDTPPEITSVRDPYYPQNAVDAGIQGVVHVRVRILEEGRISGVVEVESGPEALHASAADAVRSALFLPALAEGRPVAVWASLAVEYTLPRRRG